MLAEYVHYPGCVVVLSGVAGLAVAVELVNLLDEDYEVALLHLVLDPVTTLHARAPVTEERNHHRSFVLQRERNVS